MATSIDGGLTFSTQSYANPADDAINGITGATEVLGPMPDNESSGNNKTDTAFGYGNQMGLAVYNGQLYPIWAGNFNEATIVNNAVQGPFLTIYYQPMVVAAGPRIISSTMGPIESPYTFAGTLTEGSPSVKVTSTTGLSDGLAISGPGIPSGTTIASVDTSNNTITLSDNASLSGSHSLTVTLDYYDNPSARPAAPSVSRSPTTGRSIPFIPVMPRPSPPRTSWSFIRTPERRCLDTAQGIQCDPCPGQRRGTGGQVRLHRVHGDIRSDDSAGRRPKQNHQLHRHV